MYKTRNKRIARLEHECAEDTLNKQKNNIYYENVKISGWERITSCQRKI